MRYPCSPSCRSGAPGTRTIPTTTSTRQRQLEEPRGRLARPRPPLIQQLRHSRLSVLSVRVVARTICRQIAAVCLRNRVTIHATPISPNLSQPQLSVRCELPENAANCRPNQSWPRLHTRLNFAMSLRLPSDTALEHGGNGPNCRPNQSPSQIDTALEHGSNASNCRPNQLLPRRHIRLNLAISLRPSPESLTVANPHRARTWSRRFELSPQSIAATAPHAFEFCGSASIVVPFFGAVSGMSQPLQQRSSRAATAAMSGALDAVRRSAIGAIRTCYRP
jgi:hypothetical protein